MYSLCFLFPAKTIQHPSVLRQRHVNTTNANSVTSLWDEQLYHHYHNHFILCPPRLPMFLASCIHSLNTRVKSSFIAPIFCSKFRIHCLRNVLHARLSDSCLLPRLQLADPHYMDRFYGLGPYSGRSEYFPPQDLILLSRLHSEVGIQLHDNEFERT
jgi:hypothetical protein